MGWGLFLVGESSQEPRGNQEAEDEQGEKGEHDAHSNDHQFNTIFQHGILATVISAAERARVIAAKCLERRASMRSCQEDESRGRFVG